MHTLGSVAVHTLQNEDADMWAALSRAGDWPFYCWWHIDSAHWSAYITHLLSSTKATALSLSLKRNQARSPDHMTAQSAARGRGGGERWPHIIVRSTICPCKYVVLCWTSPHRGTDGCASPNCANKQVVFETCMAQCTRADYTPVGIIFSVSLCSCKLYAYTSQKLTHKSTTHLNCTVYTILANLRQSTPWKLPTLHSVTSYMYVGILYTHAVDYNCTRSVCRKIFIYVFNTCTYVIVLHNAEWCTGRDETNEGQLR